MWVQLDLKDGHSRGRQTYRCRDGHYRFIPDGNRHYFPEVTKCQALDMYAEGTGITAGVTVQTWCILPIPSPSFRA